jgi:hypothetical protein
MATDWIENLAQDIKQKNREAAEIYAREQHLAGIITERGLPFFTALTNCLEDGANAIRRQLQGDVTSADITFQTINHNDVKLTRGRFPWFDAHVLNHDASIVLDYAKGHGTPGDPNLDRKSIHFSYEVTEDGNLTTREAFNDVPRRFSQPEQLARHILELLFQP